MNTPSQLCQQHGVMMKVNGYGVLITGEPGIGKSSLALELLHQQHQLIADDVVDCQLVSNTIQASCPSMLKGFLHCRELGLIDVTQHFGSLALLESCSLDYVIELTKHSDSPSGIEAPLQFFTILEQQRPLLRLSIHSPASCYHRLLTWLSMQQQADSSQELLKRHQQALVNKHS